MPIRVKLVRDEPPAPPSSYTFVDPDTGETRTLTLEEMQAYVASLIASGKLLIEV